jgi:SNF2 family DNA or RNA helicase
VSQTHGKVERYGETWWVYTEPHLMIKLKRWFPRVEANRQGALIIRATAEVSRDLEWFMTRYPMEMKEKARAALGRESKEHKGLEHDAQEILAGKALKRELKWEVKEARDYQLVAADLALRTGHLLIADDIGLGKTLEALLILRDAGLLPCLIICQTHLPQQWKEEIEDFCPWLKPHIARKGSPYKLAQFEKDGLTPNVLIMGYSKVAGWAPVLKGKIKSVIIDECQEVRIEGSQKYVGVAMVADKADCVVGTTATPVYNYGDEIFNIMDVIAPGCLGERDEFVREWGKRIGSHIGVQDPEALRHYLIGQNLMIQRTREDVGRELPETIRVTQSIEADEIVFNELMADHIETAKILASREASREELFRLSGEFEWQLRRATGVAKAPFVAESVKGLLESGEKVVMFGWHHSVYDIWEESLADYHPVFYGGKQSPTQKLQAKGKFMDPEGDCKVMVISLRSGAGLDGLQQVSRIAVFGELDWSPTMHDQCIGRLRRDGMTDPVVAYFMVSEYGSDPFIAEKLQLKRGQSEPFMHPGSKLLKVDEEAMAGRSFRMATEFLSRD